MGWTLNRVSLSNVNEAAFVFKKLEKFKHFKLVSQKAKAPRPCFMADFSACIYALFGGECFLFVVHAFLQSFFFFLLILDSFLY